MISHSPHAAFTLIELSIILVVIGLLIGGLLSGRELVRAAELRSVLSQAEQFKTAAVTFRGKHGALPGDMPDKTSQRLGFYEYKKPSFWNTKLGNDDGFIGDMNQSRHIEEGCVHECSGFWRHLADAGLLADSVGSPLSNADPYDEENGLCYTLPHDCASGDFRHLYLPKSRIGGAFWGMQALYTSLLNPYYHGGPATGLNLWQNTLHLLGGPAAFANRPSLSALDLASLDGKADDSKPNTGKVLASPFAYDPEAEDFHAKHWSQDEPPDDDSPFCTTGGANATDPATRYNVKRSSGGDRPACIPILIW